MLIESQSYDGVLLHQRFAYRLFRDQVSPHGNIIAFRGAMEVQEEGMIDQEDALSRDFIYSEDALNFLWELPQVRDSYAAVCFQRLFNREIADLLSQPSYLGTPIWVKGDDLMVRRQEGSWGKCSVSITHVKDQAALGHTGINVTAGSRAPRHAHSTKLSDQQCQGFMLEVIETFKKITADMFVATTKILCK